MNLIERNKIKNIGPRCWISFLIALPFWLRLPNPQLQLTLATIVLIVGAWPIFKKGFTDGLNRFTLMGLSLAIGYVYSLLGLVWGTNPVLYFKPVVSLAALILLWLCIEQALIETLLDPIRQFFDFIPKNASKLSIDGHVEIVPVDRIAKGDFVQVKPGEIIPVDGMIFSDSTVVDESILLEGMAQTKGFGKRVISGWKNVKTPCIVQADSAGNETTLAKMRLSASEALSYPFTGNIGTVFVSVIAVLSFCFLFWASVGDLAVAVGVVCTALIGASLSALEFSQTLVTMRAIGIGIRKGFILNANQKFEKKYRVDTLEEDPAVLRKFNHSISSIKAQNVFLALLYNIIVVPMALFGAITFVWAGIAMIGSSLCIVINSFRLNEKL